MASVSHVHDPLGIESVPRRATRGWKGVCLFPCEAIRSSAGMSCRRRSANSACAIGVTSASIRARRFGVSAVNGTFAGRSRSRQAICRKERPRAGTGRSDLLGLVSYFAAGTQTASGVEKSTPATSVVTVTYWSPAFFPGAAENVKRYWLSRIRCNCSRYGEKLTGA